MPPQRKQASTGAPQLGPHRATIREWLTADLSAPRKQRHTARRIWQRLVDERGATVAESTVRVYVGRVRRELTELSMFIMRLSHSGRAVHVCFPGEGQEAFLEGHTLAFERLGGVPGRVRYDNLKAAVSRVLAGRDRIESDRFGALRSHFGFDAFFCESGVGGAHEKGGVEGEVGRFRRRHLVPVPRVESLAELNTLLEAAGRTDDARHIAARPILEGLLRPQACRGEETQRSRHLPRASPLRRHPGHAALAPAVPRRDASPPSSCRLMSPVHPRSRCSDP